MSDLSAGEVMRFSVVADFRVTAGHTGYQVEGQLNTGLEEHLKTCAECRRILSKDLRDFAEQIEAMRA